MRKGQTVTLRTPAALYRLASPEEVASWIRRDRESGDIFTSAGESKLYSAVQSVDRRTETDTTFVILQAKGVDLPGWYRDPVVALRSVATGLTRYAFRRSLTVVA